MAEDEQWLVHELWCKQFIIPSSYWPYCFFPNNTCPYISNLWFVCFLFGFSFLKESITWGFFPIYFTCTYLYYLAFLSLLTNVVTNSVSIFTLQTLEPSRKFLFLPMLSNSSFYPIDTNFTCIWHSYLFLAFLFLLTYVITFQLLPALDLFTQKVLFLAATFTTDWHLFLTFPNVRTFPRMAHSTTRMATRHLQS